MRYPVNQPFQVTTQFGVRDSNAKFGYHSGLDFAVPLNRAVYAPVSGELKNVLSPTGGNMVVIFDGQYYHRLMHNNSFVRDNGPVNEGEVVAKAGTTGLSTGVHSHWDITKKAVPESFNDFINPNELMKGDTEMLSRESIQVVYNIAFDQDAYPVAADVFKAYTGKPHDALLTHIQSDPTWIAHKKAINSPVSGNPKLDALGKAIKDFVNT